MVNGKELVGALLQGWNIGAATVKTVSVVERLTTLLGQSNALDNVGEVVRRLQQYDNLTELTNKVSMLIERVYRLESAFGDRPSSADRAFDESRRKLEHDQLMKLLSEVQVELAKRAIDEDQPKRFTGWARATLESVDPNRVFVDVQRSRAHIAREVADLCGEGESVLVMTCSEGFDWIVIGPHVDGDRSPLVLRRSPK